MPALVRTDAAEPPLILQICNMLLDRAARYPKRSHHDVKGNVRICRQQVQHPVPCFLTAFSYRFFLTASWRPIRRHLRLTRISRRQPDQQITALQFMRLVQQKIAEEPLKVSPITFDPLLIIGIVRPHKRIAEIPRVLLEHVVRRAIAERLQVFDRENGRRARIALAKRMHLPDLGDETGEMRDDLRRRLAAVVKFAFVRKIAYERLFQRRRIPVGHGRLLQHPFVLADVDRPQFPRRRKNAREQLLVNGDEIFRGEGEAAVIDDRDDALRHLVRFLQFGIGPGRFILRRIIIANTPPRLGLSDSSFNVFLGRLDQKARSREPVNLLEPNRRRPRIRAFAPPRFLRLEISGELLQRWIVIRHQASAPARASSHFRRSKSARTPVAAPCSACMSQMGS